MYVRDAKNRDEVWLLDNIEAMGLDDVAFRSRDYVIAVDETTDERAGFGRLRVHKGESTGRGDEGEVVELTCVGVPEEWREQGVGAHVVERLVDTAGDEGFETVYVLTDEPGYLAQFGFEAVPTDALPGVLQDRLAEQRDALGDDVVGTAIDVEEFEMPSRFRERFKRASPEPSAGDGGADGAEERPEDFGIDPEEATYKYDTGR
jgi:N-acetylglutamate synthase-like GNAT family acetyltransferase